jgi:hypothetical protein
MNPIQRSGLLDCLGTCKYSEKYTLKAGSYQAHDSILVLLCTVSIVLPLQPLLCLCSLSNSGNLGRDDIEIRRRTTVTDGVIACVRVSNAIPTYHQRPSIHNDIYLLTAQMYSAHSKWHRYLSQH